jgi:hypothetical protein
MIFPEKSATFRDHAFEPEVLILKRQTFDDEIEEKPLDPAVERVRKKLVRFVAINLGLLFAALMAVVAAIVYKSGHAPPADGPATIAEIALPAGAKMIGHGFSEGQFSIDAELADGSRVIIVYDVAGKKIVGRYTVTAK